MGIYTSNRYLGEAYDYASEIPVNEAYDAAFGCAHILADCQVNDMALFESTIYNDIAEVRSVQEGYGYVNENAFTSVLKKLAEAFKKLLGKIKGIFSAFIAKLTGAFKDGKELVKKYEKQIIKYANWKDFKCTKVREPKKGISDLKETINTVFQAQKISAFDYELSKSSGTSDGRNIILGLNKFGNLNTAQKVIDADAEDIKTELLKKYLDKVNVTEESEIHEEVMNYLFEDEDTIDGDDQVKSASYFSANWIKTLLSEGEKWQKDVKKFNEKLEKNINTIIDNLNKADNNIAKFMSNNDNKYKLANLSDRTFNAKDDGKVQKGNYDVAAKIYNKSEKKTVTIDGENKEINSGDDFLTLNYVKRNENLQKAIHAMQKIANNEQEVITKITSEYMTVVKFSLANARRVWTAAAAWSSGVHKESVEYADAMGDVAAEQFYTNMESIH